jgi:hypothetical protein
MVKMRNLKNLKFSSLLTSALWLELFIYHIFKHIFIKCFLKMAQLGTAQGKALISIVASWQDLPCP